MIQAQFPGCLLYPVACDKPIYERIHQGAFLIKNVASKVDICK